MLPDHNGAAPQTTKPPFMVEYVPGSYPGEPVTGTGNTVVFILLNLFITAMSGVIIIYFFFFYKLLQSLFILFSPNLCSDQFLKQFSSFAQERGIHIF